MPNPSRRPPGTSRNPYELTPDERAAQQRSYNDDRVRFPSSFSEEYVRQLQQWQQAVLQPVPPPPTPLPIPTEKPRRVIDAAVRAAVADLQSRCHLHTRHQQMPDPYALSYQMTDMHRQMEQRVLGEMTEQLKKKIRFTVHPDHNSYGKVVDAEVVIMSPAELLAFGDNVARQVIDACVKQGYFR